MSANQPEDIELRKALGNIEVPYEDRSDLSVEWRETYLSKESIDKIMQLIEAEASRREQALLDELSDTFNSPAIRDKDDLLETLKHRIFTKRQALNEKEKS